MAKETYSHGKRDLLIWQKRPTHMAKETYAHGKSNLLIRQNRPAEELFVYVFFFVFPGFFYLFFVYRPAEELFDGIVDYAVLLVLFLEHCVHLVPKKNPEKIKK